MHGAEHLAVGIALVGLVVGIALFTFAYGAVKSFAQTSLGAGLAHICRTAFGFDALYDIVLLNLIYSSPKSLAVIRLTVCG